MTIGKEVIGKCIVFVACHGKSYGYGHHTITGNANFVIAGWFNTVKLSEYKSMIESITDDGTHVLLWVSACHGDGLDYFMGADSHNRLETWSFRPEHRGLPSNGEVDWVDPFHYNYFCWLYNYTSGVLNTNSECAFFFAGADEGAYQKTVTYLGKYKIRPYYNSVFNTEEHDYCQMYIQMTWGTYAFYVNTG